MISHQTGLPQSFIHTGLPLIVMLLFNALLAARGITLHIRYGEIQQCWMNWLPKHLPPIVNSIAPLVWNSKTDKCIYPSSLYHKNGNCIHSHIKVQTSLCRETLRLIASATNPKNVDTTDAEMPKKFSRLVILAVLSTMSTPPSNLKLRIGLSLASFASYPQIDHSSKQTSANRTKYKQSFSSFLNFPKPHVYQLRVASLYKYEFWDSLQSITNRKETQDTAFWSNKDNWRTWVWVQLFPRQFEIKPWVERERERESKRQQEKLLEVGLSHILLRWDSNWSVHKFFSASTSRNQPSAQLIADYSFAFY